MRIKSSKQDTLSSEIEKGSEGGVWACIRTGADVNKVDSKGCNPLSKALACSAPSSIVRLLCHEKADVSDKEIFDVVQRHYYRENVRLIAEQLNAKGAPTYRIPVSVNAIIAAYAAEYPLNKKS